MSIKKALPRLTSQNHRIASPATVDYNCIAWAAGDSHHWWQPGKFWPFPSDAINASIDVLQQAFQIVGFQEATDAGPEPGFEKVALYADGPFYTHAARQLPSGKWTSKLGKAEDIEHDTPDDVAGGVYGELVKFMRRPRVE